MDYPTRPGALPLSGGTLTGFVKYGGTTTSVPTEPRTFVGGAGAPAFKNGFTNYGNGFQSAAFWKDATGTVHLQGMVAGGTDGLAVFTLPAGYRPAATMEFAALAFNGSTAGFANVRVATTGDITFFIGSASTYGSLDGLAFLAEA